MAGKERDVKDKYEGWVYKRGHFNPAFKHRFFVLSQGVLRYFDNRDDYYSNKASLGTIPCKGLSVDLQPQTAGLGDTLSNTLYPTGPSLDLSRGNKDFTFTIRDARGRQTICRVETPEDLAIWVQSLRAASNVLLPSLDSDEERTDTLEFEPLHDGAEEAEVAACEDEQPAPKPIVTTRKMASGWMMYRKLSFKVNRDGSADVTVPVNDQDKALFCNFQLRECSWGSFPYCHITILCHAVNRTNVVVCVLACA